ncbi:MULTISPECIES: hypothetical protein [unclassified Streptomyces]|uniref:hypothetical protein n=1 Tax=unclassified Streptomyces TaxID=2593676 RepID=UPI00048BC372|nr:hypothetical protein [Streptomyces sp. DpondAA-D4]MYY15395.1 hypothetical protein [Streptomyces sp. SID4912]SCE30600.1 hypothetical protein GA0115241_112750 [Streptomyces sp. DpondAA-D4]
MSGGGGWADGSAGHIPAGGGSGPSPGGGPFLALTRCWAAGALVYIAAGFLVTRTLVETLATGERLDLFGWRLALLHLPGVLITVLTVLASARALPDEHRGSRTRYLSATLAVPLAGLAYGYAVSWDLVNSEGILMPVVAMVTGACVGLALDRLLEDRADTPPMAPVPSRRLYGRPDGGATAVEYLGVVVLVAALFGALALAGLGGRIGDGIRCAITSLTGGGGCVAGGNGTTAPRTDADYEPKLCQISNISDTAGGKVKIGWFEWGEEYGFQQRVSQASTDVNGDGTVDENDRLVHMTFTDAASAGVNASTPGVKLGNLGKADIDIGGGIRITNGDTWVFTSEAEAERMRDDIEEMKMWETSMTHSGGYGGNWYAATKWAGKTEDIERKIGDKKISYSTIGLDVYADGGLAVKAGDDTALGAKLGGRAVFSPEVTVTKDDVNGNESATYTARLELEAKAAGNAGPLGGTVGVTSIRTGSLTVTRDQKTGTLVRIDMTQTVEDASVSGAVEIGGDNGEKGADKRGGKGGVTDSSGATGIGIRTDTLVFGKETDQATAGRRAVAERWLDGSGDSTAPFAYMFGDRSPQQRPTDDDPFEQLMFEEGLSSTMRYHGEADAQEFGFEVSLGMSLGFSLSGEHKQETLTDARFLGAPQGDRRGYLPYSYCAQ